MNSNKKSKIISIIVPCFNEEENVVHFYKAIQTIFQITNYNFEIIYIDDGSHDNTLNVLYSLTLNNKEIKVISFSRNFGKEIALSAGLEYALGDAVIPMDVDMQDPPELIPELIKKWEEGYDVVYATRKMRKGEGFFKKLTAKIFYKLISLLTKIKIPQNTGDFRIMDKKVVNALKQLKENHRFMKGLFAWVGFKQIGISYVREGRFAGKTKFNFIKLFNLAIEGITSFSVAPLRLASIFGFSISIISFLYAVYTILNKLLFGNNVAGYPSLLVVILFLGGIQLLCLGIIGEYVGRIFNETKNRPIYIIRDLFNINNSDKKV